jgi:hypothetical protein
VNEPVQRVSLIVFKGEFGKSLTVECAVGPQDILAKLAHDRYVHWLAWLHEFARDLVCGHNKSAELREEAPNSALSTAQTSGQPDTQHSRGS